MKWMAKLEQKFGKFAIPRLTLVLIICYVVGFVLEYAGRFTGHDFTSVMTLNPYAIVHGQVWRLASWVLIPPKESNIFFAVVMLFFYFSIGSTLEKAWGDFQYNVYLLSGMLFTILGSFILYGIFAYMYYVPAGGTITINGTVFHATDATWAFPVKIAEASSSDENAALLFQQIFSMFTTYYVNMSIFLAYAATFPDNRVLLMFFIPIKVKVLGFIYGGFIAYEMIANILYWNQFGFWFVPVIVIGASLLNFLVFFLTTRRYILQRFRRTQTQRAYSKHVREFKRNERVYSAGVTSKHKCAVCGRTEHDSDELVFRFCSKCQGNYEYCQDHLYTHVHYSPDGPVPKSGPDIIEAGKEHVTESVYHRKEDKPEGFY